MATSTQLESFTNAEAGNSSAQLAKLPKSPNTFSYWLDFFRWTAALAVVFTHCGDIFLVRITDTAPGHRYIPLYLFSFISGFAHQAVMVFFVLSGYLVGGGLLNEARKRGQIDISNYLVKRISRLCIVLYPAFALIALADVIGIFVFHGVGTGVYSPDTLHTMSLPSLICNALFLHTALSSSFGNDGALWSLFNEFWYYVSWPLILLGLRSRSRSKQAILLLSACALLLGLTKLQFIGAAIGPYMLIWLLGVGVAWKRTPLFHSVALSATLFMIALLSVRLAVRRSFSDDHPIWIFLVDFLVSALFANLLLSMKFNKTLPMPSGAQFNTSLAAFSFSLYCIHMPVFDLIAAAFRFYTHTTSQMLPDQLWKWGFVLGTVALSLGTALLFSRLTEVHTADLRSWLSRTLRLNNRRSRLAA